MAQHRSTDGQESPSLEQAKLIYERVWKALPEDFPEDLKRLAFEKVLEHQLMSLRDRERFRQEEALEKARLEARKYGDEVFFRAFTKVFDSMLGALERLDRPPVIIPIGPAPAVIDLKAKEEKE